MNFTKLQGAGNDFVLIEGGRDASQNWSQMAKSICDRHFGVGADGILLLLPSNVADFRMREFNPDGSEAAACGNGLRCLAKYAVDIKLANSAVAEISIETMAGIRKCKSYRARDNITSIQVGMGRPKFGAEEIPVLIEQVREGVVDIIPVLSYSITIEGGNLPLEFVSMGNPHAIYFWEKPPAEFPLSRIGPEIERHKIFPKRTNFEVARVIDRRQIEVRVWERGVGETLACGSGACAVAVAAQLHGYADSKVAVKLPGGTLDVEWDGVGEVSLCGPAEIVFTGEWSE
ncbi:diaminopimelate epimerase [Chloroflexota bacterium]